MTDSQPAPAPKATILFADDEPLVLALGQTILQRNGYFTLGAADGEQAVELYRKHQAEIDLVILDVTMPLLSGMDVLRVLRQINPQLRAVIASGFQTEDEPAPDLECVQGIVNKPYRPHDLLQVIEKALAAPMPPGEPT